MGIFLSFYDSLYGHDRPEEWFTSVTREFLRQIAKKKPSQATLVRTYTFLRKLAEEKGVHYAKEASGHRSDRYIWRYVKPSQQSLAEAVDELD